MMSGLRPWLLMSPCIRLMQLGMVYRALPNFHSIVSATFFIHLGGVARLRIKPSLPDTSFPGAPRTVLTRPTRHQNLHNQFSLAEDDDR